MGVKPYWLNFNPRTGLSWRLNDSNVLGAGYGVSAEGAPSTQGQVYPIAQAPLIEGPNAFTSPGSLATGILAPSFAPIPDSGIVPAVGPLLTQGFTNILTTARHNGRLHSWNIAYQRTLPGAFTAEVAYVGNRAEDPSVYELVTARPPRGSVVGEVPSSIQTGSNVV